MNSSAVNLPPLTEVDWQLVADAGVVLVGAGAVAVSYTHLTLPTILRV